MIFALCVPEMIEACAKEIGQRCERTNVATQIAAVCGIVAIGLDHHRHCVPAHVSTQALFDFNVAGISCFLIGLNGVDIAGSRGKRHVDTALPRVFKQLLQEEVRTLWTFSLDHGRQSIHPLASFLGIGIIGS